MLKTFRARIFLGTAAVAVVSLAVSAALTAASVRHAALVGFAVALPGALIVAWGVSWLIGRRAAELAAAARRRTTGESAGSGGRGARDELGVIADALDETLDQLGRRLVEQARDRARLEALLAGMIEGVLLVDGRGQVQVANDAARRLLGQPDGREGRSYLEWVRHPGVAALVAAALGGERPGPLELSIGDPAVTASARAAPLDAPGGRGVLLVLHDISELRRADRIRRDFVANVSHELRTPLTAIRGYLEALEDAPDPAEQRRFAEVIARHTRRMERLVRDLLRLARLDAGYEAVEERPVGVRAVFETVAADLQPAADRRGQRLVLEVAPEAATVVTDRHKLEDALRNLVENAVSHGTGGTEIQLAAARAGDRLELQVLDRGPGIPETDLPRIFERFYRVDRSRAADSGGTGLGLSIARHLVERLGGELRAANRPGGGAIFTISLSA